MCTGSVEIAEVGRKVGALRAGGKQERDSNGLASFVGALVQMNGENCQIITDAIGLSVGDERRRSGRAIPLGDGHATGECYTFDQGEDFAHDCVSAQSSKELTLFHAPWK
jgi:hypothetical protein